MATLQSTVYLYKITIYAIFLSCAASLSAVAQEAPAVPNFWDPKAVLDRPADIPAKIQFLAVDHYPPFVFRDANNQLTGFNVDLARAICQELETSCSLRIKKFEDLQSALEDEEGDAIISGLARTPDLAKGIYFSDDYLKLPARFIVKAGRETEFTEEAIADVKIAVEAGSRHHAFAKKFWPDAILMPFDTVEEARMAVANGAADAHFGDGLSLSFWLNSEAAANCCRFAGGPWLEPGYFDEGLSIAMRKEDVEIREAINYALRRLQQTGVYRELYLRYFPISFF